MKMNGEKHTSDHLLLAPLDWKVIEIIHPEQLKSLRPHKIIYHNPELDAKVVDRSRQHRKNRYPELLFDAKTTHLVRPFPRLILVDLSNISWHVAMLFTLGSICWVINGQYYMWPLQNSSQNQLVTSISALLGGALFFWLGAYSAILEAINQNASVNFGTATYELIQKSSLHPLCTAKRVLRLKNAPHNIYNHHTHDNENYDDLLIKQHKHDTNQTWRWYGIDYSTGYIASLVQFTGATCFTVSVVVGMFTTSWLVQQVLVWAMQIIGSVCFLISSCMLMLEEQDRWYALAYDRIGWHSAFWNVVGSVGFLLCACFGLLADWQGRGAVCCQYWGTIFSTYWGSWAFLIASVLQLIEVENKQQLEWEDMWRKVKVLLCCGCCEQDADT